jgi:hypothetical protein
LAEIIRKRSRGKGRSDFFALRIILGFTARRIGGKIKAFVMRQGLTFLYTY